MANISSDGLRSPKQKILRANAHIRDLDAAVKGFLGTDPFDFSWIADDPGPDKHLVAKAIAQPPDEIALLIGDAAHNLRTALDHLACCLAIHNGAVRVNDVYFPITKFARDFDGGARRKIAKLSPEAQDMIYALKPYGGGNELFCSLNSLDNADKHQSIVAAIAVGGITKAKITYDQPISVNRKPHGHLDKGVHLLTVPKIASGQCAAELSTYIEVSEVAGLEGKPIVGALQEFVDLVAGVIEVFERRFFI